ncbi:MAG: (Fe-S)-binding protein [Cyclobacteriaceae bacterium]|nr:(Fe-S)-binding protein [Cyclobacteriaceae bacterium]
MQHISQIVFIITLGVFGFLAYKRVSFLRNCINLGKKELPAGSKAQRLKEMIFIAFGQKKMFKKPLAALLHFFVYFGFLIINIEVLEFIIDGITGHHRVFAPFLGKLYPVLMNIFELLALAVMVSCLIFLSRRNILKIKRFWSAEMQSWPRLDANLILVIEVLLMLAIIHMNTADQILQERNTHYTATGKLWISSLMIPAFTALDTGTLIFIERFAWWFHIIGILGFATYVTYSKHLHIFLAFPNTYYSRFRPKGHLNNMPDVTREVSSMLGLPGATATTENPVEIGRFGAKDVHDLTVKNMMEAFSCTECGRCTAECPANLTGRKLSPRAIMMATRDRAEEIIKNKIENEEKSLLDGYISREEINACTTCNACVEACPVNISPLEIIMQLRRYIAMEESGSPAAWNVMFQNIETNFAPWKFSASDRFTWAENQE